MRARLHILLSLGLIVAIGGAVPATASATKPLPTANAAVRTNAAYTLPFTAVHKFHSTINGADYSLYIRVPPEYQNTRKAYPVIYLLDADYSFPVAVNISDMLGRHFTQAQEAIIVGIGYTGQYPSEEKYRANRTRDYTPPPRRDAANAAKNSGGAPTFLRVIEKEVIAYIEANYRTADDRTLVGHSYGGLFAAWVLQERPDMFHRYLMVSPSLWYNDEAVLAREETETMLPLARRTLVYMAIGSDENLRDGPKMIDELNRFAKALVMRRDPNLVMQNKTFEDETHASIFPIAFSTGLRHLFGEMDGRSSEALTSGMGH